jgi:hypothetical protein
MNTALGEECWKAIPGFTGYEASSTGKVRSYHKRGGGSKWSLADVDPIILKPSQNKRSKYLGVNLALNGTTHYIRIHQLVLLTFRGPCPEGLEVCHNDGDATNNNIENLRYDSHLRNTQEAKHPCKLSPDEVVLMRELRALGWAGSSLSKKFHVSKTVVTKVCLGRSYCAIGGPIAKLQRAKTL